MNLRRMFDGDAPFCDLRVRSLYYTFSQILNNKPPGEHLMSDIGFGKG